MTATTHPAGWAGGDACGSSLATPGKASLRTLCFLSNSLGPPANPRRNPTEWTIRDLVATVERFLGRALPVTVHPLPTDDSQVRQPDTTRARTLLGWELAADLAAGLRQTLAYFQKTQRTSG